MSMGAIFMAVFAILLTWGGFAFCLGIAFKKEQNKNKNKENK